MPPQYQIPFNLCQWCYKSGGRFIVDCLCVVCQACFKSKKQWFSEPGKCFCCQKSTLRRCIDLKTNPQQGGIYFQNINMNLKNLAKVQEFQNEVTKKYCKFLQKKTNKLESIILSFVNQFPAYRPYFQKAFLQQDSRQSTNAIRSKSVQSSSRNNSFGSNMLPPNHSQKSILSKPTIQQNPAINQIHNNSKNTNYSQSNKYLKNHPNFSVASKQSRTSNFSEENQIKKLGFPNFGNQNKNMLKVGKNSESSSKHFIQQYDDNQNFPTNPPYQKKSLHLPSNQYIQYEQLPITKIEGNKKFSDPTKQMNLKNINMQTAIRSIRSEEQRAPFYQNSFQSRKKQDPTDNLIQYQYGQQLPNAQSKREMQFEKQRRKKFPK